MRNVCACQIRKALGSCTNAYTHAHAPPRGAWHYRCILDLPACSSPSHCLASSTNRRDENWPASAVVQPTTGPGWPTRTRCRYACCPKHSSENLFHCLCVCVHVLLKRKASFSCHLTLMGPPPHGWILAETVHRPETQPAARERKDEAPL